MSPDEWWLPVMALNVGLVRIDQYDDIAKIERIESSSGIRKTNLSK